MLVIQSISFIFAIVQYTLRASFDNWIDVFPLCINGFLRWEQMISHRDDLLFFLVQIA